jgi:antitoxin VapB
MAPSQRPSHPPRTGKRVAQRNVRAYLLRRPPAIELAGRLAALCRCTEAEAVLRALENEVARTEGRLTLAERLKPLQDRIAAAPPTGLEADKDFFDDLCGDD